MKPTVYLAGSIRDTIPEDTAWRERAIDRLGSVAQILSPLAGKTFDTRTGLWWLYGYVEPDAKYIVHADFWCVDRADILLVDFRSLQDGYPSIETLMELGRSTNRSCLRVGVVSAIYTGRGNAQHFKGLHPFLEHNCAKVFNTMDQAIEFVYCYCQAVTTHPRYKGGA